MRIVLFLLKCVVGLFATIGFLLVAGVAVVALLWDRVEPLAAQRAPLPEAMVLTLDLAPGMIERRPQNPLSRATLSGVPVLRETLETLDAAADDPRVRGLFARVGRGALGLAAIQELRDAIAEFRGRGKFAFAFAETFGPSAQGTLHYYLASAFDRVWLQPSGDLDVSGFVIESPFLREAFDEIGVLPRLDQRGAYKGAMNIYTDRSLPEEQRSNLQRLVDSWLGQVVSAVAERRGLSEDEVRGLVDRAPYRADEAMQLRLIDQVGYWDEALADTLRAAGLDDRDGAPPLVPLSDYAQGRDPAPAEGPVIALVHGLGPVVLDDSDDDPVFGGVTMGADTVSRAIRDAADDPEVRAIVFRVDSPGGSYLASDTIWREMRRAREREIPVVVTMGNLAASGGYFVAAPAHRIVAQPGTVTGSIGVVGGKLVISELWDNLGIGWDGVKAGARADYWSPNRDFSREEWLSFRTWLDRVYLDFTQKVAEGRDLPMDMVLEIAEGRVWSGADAMELGLVDALGGYRTAFTLAGQAAGLGADDPFQVRVFPQERDPFEAFFEDALAGELDHPGLRSLARGLARVMRALAPLVETMEALTGAPQGPRLEAPRLEPVQPG